MRNGLLLRVVSLLVVMVGGTMAAQQPVVGPKMLEEGGDCLGDEVLA